SLLERSKSELDRGRYLELGPGSPRLVETLAQRFAHGQDRLVHEPPLVGRRLKAMRYAQRLRATAKLDARDRVTASEDYGAGHRKQFGQGVCVPDRAAQSQALAQILGRLLDVTAVQSDDRQG